MNRVAILICAALLALAAAGVLAIHRAWIPVPPQWLPWTPLVVSETPNYWTRHKLARLSSDAEACRAVLHGTAIEFEPLTDRVTGENCGFQDAVLVKRVPAEVGEAFSLTCRAAVSLAMWERHSLQPAARAHLGQDVTGIEHFGSYSCRNVYGRPNATRSRHATAEAWDVAGFVLADGRRVRVARDWKTTAPEAAFLREVRDGACRFFDGVLSPDYNAAHHDHLHLDRGTFRTCR